MPDQTFPHVVPLQGGSNFRDLGGYPAAEGKTVKWGRIYRSADISKLTEADLSTLADRHIAKAGAADVFENERDLVIVVAMPGFPAAQASAPARPRSTSTTLIPRRARERAAASPATPPPTTTASAPRARSQSFRICRNAGMIRQNFK